MNTTRSKQVGFTLIEIMIVVAIIGILAAIAVPQYQNYVKRGNIQEAIGALSDYRIRMEQWYQDNRSYQIAGGGACGVPIPVISARWGLVCTPGATTQTFLATVTGVPTNTMKNFAYALNEQNAQTTTSLPTDWAGSYTFPVARWITSK